MEQATSKTGICPNCKSNWAGGDIMENIKSLDVSMSRTPKELKALGDLYNYNPEKPANFSKVEQIDIDDKKYWRCTNCGEVWDAITKEHVEIPRGMKLHDL